MGIDSPIFGAKFCNGSIRGSVQKTNIVPRRSKLLEEIEDEEKIQNYRVFV
jgi:hypothetical protein